MPSDRLEALAKARFIRNTERVGRTLILGGGDQNPSEAF